MYDEVDRYHIETDNQFISLDQNDTEKDYENDEDMNEGKTSVLDLSGGVNGCSDEDEDNDSAFSSNLKYGKDSSVSATKMRSSYNSNDTSDDDDDMLIDYNQKQESTNNWGKNKALYYHGDTFDLEIGQEEEDAFLEEEAAKEIQATRFGDMEEDDFFLFDEENGDKKGSAALSAASDAVELKTVDASKLTKKANRRILNKKYPDILQMVSYFSGVVKDLKDRTQVATNALTDGKGTAESVGATTKGKQYLVLKCILQKSIALNSVVYLLLRYASAGNDNATANIQSHPVMDQLQKFDSLLSKLNENFTANSNGIYLQMDILVKAAELMMNGSVSDSSSSDDDGSQTGTNDEDKVDNCEVVDSSDKGMADNMKEGRNFVQKQIVYKSTLNEARFGLRSNELSISSSFSRRKSSHTQHLEDFGDVDDEYDASDNILASTFNNIEQRSKTASRKRRKAPAAEQLDELDKDDDQVSQGIQMMEEKLGKFNNDEGAGERIIIDDKPMINTGDDNHDEDELLQYYSKVFKRGKEKKSSRRYLYKVAPKFPVVEGEVVGERAINRTILKNRGLVAHKTKINRNPRVKKREQYRKALIRRKGMVRQVRNEDGHIYGGEETGIKTRISRSRKLSSK